MSKVVRVGDGDVVEFLTSPSGRGYVEFRVQIVPDHPVPPDPPAPVLPPFEDVIALMPTNPRAPNPPASPGRWATRTPEQIKGVTVHHTGSHDYMAVARYCTGAKGLPCTQYAYWVAADGAVLKCVEDNIALWHDHAGYPNSHLAVGMAGWLHKVRPPVAQIEGLARLCAYLMREYAIPVARVVGHRDRAAPARVGTECPGWYPPPIGSGWKPDFDAALAALL